VSGAASAVLAAPEELAVRDLPVRPPRRDNEPSAPISATERVKPATDKPEPRFEAARQRLAREYKLRARAEAARQARETGAGEADRTPPPAPPKKGFSFNQTSRPLSAGKPKADLTGDDSRSGEKEYGR
jgi:hypothetical protein